MDIPWEDKMDIPITNLLQGLPNLDILSIGDIHLVRIFVFVFQVIRVSSKKEFVIGFGFSI